MDSLLGKAHSQMISLASAVSANNEDAVDEDLKSVLGAAAQSAAATVEEQPAEEAAEEEVEEEEEDAEEGGMAGLGALFG
jgi:large subunit ribosomal protein L10